MVLVEILRQAGSRASPQDVKPPADELSEDAPTLSLIDSESPNRHQREKADAAVPIDRRRAEPR